MNPHGIPRDEWERRFKAEIIKGLDLDAEKDDDIAEAELESWPDDEQDWKLFSPESCASESLSYWENDEGEA